MSDFKAKMHKIRFPLGLRPRPRWGSLQRFLRPLAVFKGTYFSGEGGGKGREGEGEGKGRGGPQIFWPRIAPTHKLHSSSAET